MLPSASLPLVPLFQYSESVEGFSARRVPAFAEVAALVATVTAHRIPFDVPFIDPAITAPGNAEAEPVVAVVFQVDPERVNALIGSVPLKLAVEKYPIPFIKTVFRNRSPLENICGVQPPTVPPRCPMQLMSTENTRPSFAAPVTRLVPGTRKGPADISSSAADIVAQSVGVNQSRIVSVGESFTILSLKSETPS